MLTLDSLKTDLLFNVSRATNVSLARPDWVSINLTLRCNLRCPMCTTCYDVVAELSTHEVLDVIDQVSLWGVRILNPLGGEPFVRDDLLEILEYACLKDFYITLTTNGTLVTPEIARGIARIAYDRLHFNISLDGFRKENDKVRGPGAFDQALEGYRAIRDADVEAGNPPRKIVVNCVVNNLNLDSIPEFLDHCREQTFQGIQLLSLFKKSGPDVPRAIRHLWIPPARWADLDRTVDAVLDYKARTDPQKFSIANSRHELDIMKLYYRNALPPRKAKCYAGWKELYINSDGQAIMCDGNLDFLSGAFGNVRQQTLQQLWASSALRTRRRAVRACVEPCIQDCYLRESSDSLMGIARDKGRALLSQARRFLETRHQRLTTLPGTQLTLELSDVADVNPTHDAQGARGRFEQLIVKRPGMFARCYEDPFEYYELRNRGYLNFNRGFMGFELIRRFVPDLVRFGARIDSVRLGLRGDPLLHPEYVPVYRYLLEQSRRHQVFGEIRVDTHATLLNTEYVDIAVEARDVNQTFFIVLDAATAETYHAINGADLQAVVLERLAYLLTMKARRRAGHVRLIFVFTVMPGNLEEVRDFQTMWSARLRDQGLPLPRAVIGDASPIFNPRDRSDLIFFRRKDNDNFLDQIESNKALTAAAEALGAGPIEVDRDAGRMPRCAAPFKTPTITWDGKVTTCDQDRFLELHLGEVTAASLVDIWWRKESAKALRRAVRHGELHRRPPCRDCRFPFSPNAPKLNDDERKHL